MLNSTRRGISYPSPDRSDISDVPAHIKNLVDALEIDVIYVQGTNAQRLAAVHMAGVLWYATDTGLFWWDTGTTWVALNPPPSSGTELVYAERTTDLSVSSSVLESAPLDVISIPNVVFDGTTAYWFEFFAACANLPNAAGPTFGVNLWVAGADQGRLVFLSAATSSGQTNLGCTGSRKLTPAAGTVTVAARAWAGVGTTSLRAGTGGAVTNVPAYLRVLRA
jgi:hypothetical protein